MDCQITGELAWPTRTSKACRERDFFVDNLLIRIHFIIIMIRWTGLAPWEFEFPFTGSLTSTFLSHKNAPPLYAYAQDLMVLGGWALFYERGTFCTVPSRLY